MSVDGARPVSRIVCDQVVVGFGPTTRHDTAITALPTRVVTGFDPDHGPPWQLIGDTADTAVMHLLLLGPDDDAVRPSLGRGPRSEPWPTGTTRTKLDARAGADIGLHERELPTSLTIARARSARGLHAGHAVGSQLILAQGHRTDDPSDRHLFALTRDLATGDLAAYSHHVGSDHWKRYATPNHRWVSRVYQRWPSSLLNAPGDTAPTGDAAQPLSTTTFAEQLRSNLSLVMSQAAHTTTDDSMAVVVLPDEQRELTDGWLSGCDRRADEALANGVEAMLETYLTAMSHETTPAWAKLCQMIDRAQGLPHNHWPMVSGEDWSPYGNQRATTVAELVRTMPRRSPAPSAAKAVFKRMQTTSPTGVFLRSQAQLGPGGVRHLGWGAPARTRRPG